MKHAFTRFSPILFIGMIMLVGFFLRFVGLTQTPVGLNWDEASVGYNAYSLLKTGTDEFGRSWPLFIESFGDYKTGLYSMLIVPIIRLLGLSVFSVRIANVFIGTTAILAAAFFGFRYFQRKEAAYVLAILMATSPLAIHLSRFTLEWYAGLPFFLIGLGLILPSKKMHWTFVLGAFFLACSVYWYHSLRLFLPLLMIAYALINRSFLLKNKKIVSIAICVGVFTVLPLLFAMKHDNILARPQAVSVFSNENQQRNRMEYMYRYAAGRVPLRQVFTNKITYFGNEILYRYINHFSFDYLFFGKDATPRISVYPIGKIQLALLPFLVLGCVHVMKQRKKHALLLAWVLLSPLPASLSNDAPHGLRGLFLLPALHILIALGLFESWEYAKKIEKKWQRTALVCAVAAVFLGNTVQQLSYYFLFYSEETAIHWQADQQSMIQTLQKYENAYDRIVVTKADGQPHIFYAFFTQMDPVLYQQQVKNQTESFNTRITHLGKIKFGVDAQDFCIPNTLVVTKDFFQIEEIKPIDISYMPDRFHQPKPSFYFYDSNDPGIQKKVCTHEMAK